MPVLSLALASKAFDLEIYMLVFLVFRAREEKKERKKEKAKHLQLRPQVNILHMISNEKKIPKIHENEKHGEGEGGEGQKLDWDWEKKSDIEICCCYSVTKPCLTLQSHKLQHARLPCPPLCPRVCSNNVHWVSDAIQPSHLLLPPFLFTFKNPSGFFPMSQLFTSGGQSIGASASASLLPINIRGWFPLGLDDLISFQVLE